MACIKGLSVTSVNYKTAIDVLKERFGLASECKTEHLKSLFNVANPNSTVSQLRTFYDEVNSQMLSLLNLTWRDYLHAINRRKEKRLREPINLSRMR